ncbi:MAG: aldo/keto reductase [Candidatus Shapirobacteria bacterium]|jgi:diketogulonate reductase-like aldo/keto reductase
MITKSDFSKMGIGTWGIGGFMEADVNNDDSGQIDALSYTLNKGVNYVETVYMYAQGKAVDLLSQAVKKSGVDRNNIFVTLSVYQKDASTIEEAENRVDDFLSTLGTDHIDSVQFTMGLVRGLGLEAIKTMIDKLIGEGKTRFTSLTNSSPEFLKTYHEALGDKLFAHEGAFNFEVRENEKLGVTGYAQQNNILNVIYQPLRRNMTASRNWPLLVELSQKYGKSQNQIILNWVVSKGFFPLVKSSTKNHVDENLASFDFQIEQEDLDKLNSFEIPNYNAPKIDWYDTGEGVKIHQLSNMFDELCPPEK